MKYNMVVLLLLSVILTSCNKINNVYVNGRHLELTSEWRSSKKIYYYHIYYDCTELDNCSEVKKVSMSKARKLKFRQCYQCDRRKRQQHL